jgi:hypothetical protein
MACSVPWGLVFQTFRLDCNVNCNRSLSQCVVQPQGPSVASENEAHAGSVNGGCSPTLYLMLTFTDGRL